MRGRSLRQEIKDAMEIDKVGELKEEPQLSGAYIRSLVKQLTSSRAKDPTNPKGADSADGNGLRDQNSSKISEGASETPHTDRQQPPQQHKKQVRRRLHTSRPYQERLLNMAEARREIVTALKFHRAAMKQADEQRRKQQQEVHQDQSPSLHVSPPYFEQEARMKSRRNPRIYPSSTDNFAYLDSFSYSSFSHPPPPQNPFSWPVSPLLPSAAENLNFPLPNQTLGLNLNFHDFNIIDTTLDANSDNSNHNPSIYSSSSPSSTSSPTLSVVTEEVPSAAISYERGLSSMAEAAESYGGGVLHHAMDDQEMAEIRTIGEQHQMEWNDTMNLMTSAWWFKFLNTLEVGPEVKVEDDGYTPFDQVMEFPDWMNASESCLQQHFDDCYPDPALPCLEIGEVGGLDGDWLA